MKNIFAKGAVNILLAVSLLAFSQVCYAKDAFTKLGRGVANTLTGWVEIPKNIHDVSAEENVFAGMTLGLAKGAGLGIVRTGAGIYEIFTFPFALPEDYKPVLEPEYVF